jgi:putative membrane protein
MNTPADDKYLIKPNTRWQNVIIVTSVLIPIVVAILIYLPGSARLALIDVSILPHLNGMLNTATAACLLVSLLAILNKKIQLHKNANITAFALSALFLISYVTYHYMAAPTLFGDTDHNGLLSEAEKEATGATRTAYIILLLTHIVLAAAVVPLVLFSMYFSLSGQFAKHKRLSRFTWPVWFYVAVTGVIVYLMIKPFYFHP